MTRAVILLILWLITSLAAGGIGWSWCGSRAAAALATLQAAQQAELIDAGDALSRREYELRQAHDALAVRAMEHEDDARADPDPCRLPSADSLQRLRTRWGAATTAPD
ncbi:hypothetical protein [Pararhodobacter sp. CCB-MM2]|uniref:hypothetical protein n=1 Tax=Pararhodobacter sp. CCB-MM2 TaxID=1786003 RepID=UPI00082A42A2|nr:hypothetical protein [Pararhodobacter sp. CCB-MM2]